MSRTAARSVDCGKNMTIRSTDNRGCKGENRRRNHGREKKNLAQKTKKVNQQIGAVRAGDWRYHFAGKIGGKGREYQRGENPRNDEK